MVVILGHITIVIRTQMLIGVFFFQNMEKPIPLAHRFDIQQEIVLIGH